MQYFLAIEIGGTKLQAALVNRDGAVLDACRTTLLQGSTAEDILRWLDAEPSKLLLRYSNIKTYGSGIGFGGPVDSARGRTICSHQVQGWDDFPLQTWAENTWNLPVILENDSQAAGWAEFCLGAGKGTRNFVYMNIGSGIGGAFVSDAKLYNPQGLGAAEIGHLQIADGWAEIPGAMARLEDRCSGWSIEKRLRALPLATLEPSAMFGLAGGDAEKITCRTWGAALAQGDPVALEELDRVSSALAQAMANVITLLHPEVIALGGGVALIGAPLFAALEAKIDALVFGPYRGRYRLIPCELEEEVVIRGAGMLAAAAAFPSPLS